jgi:hypothetical protein
MKTFPKLAAGLLAALTLASASTGRAQVTNFIVDTFDPAGQGTNVYSAGMITNVWANWFGDAFVSLEWDPTMDASNNASSGSMKINLNFGQQFLVFNGFNAWGVPFLGLQWTNLQCDVRFAPGSATNSTGFGHLEFGTASSNDGGATIGGQQEYGGVEIPATNSNWVHVSLPINYLANSYFTNIWDVLIHIYGPWGTPSLSGTSTLWIDNIKLVGRTNTVITERPVVTRLSPAAHALRFFASDPILSGQPGFAYNREQIATTSDTVAWYNAATYPWTYSFTITNFPDKAAYPGFDFHLFLIASNGLSTFSTPWADYGASNVLEFRVSGNYSNYLGSLTYKVNAPNASPVPGGGSPALTLANMTNATAIGTWILTFNDNLSGTISIGTNSASFTMPAADAALFQNSVVAYFGVMANNTNNLFQAADISQVSAGVGNVFSDNFSAPSYFTLDTGLWDTNASSMPACIWEAIPGSRFWVAWTVPEDVYTPVISTNLGLGSLGFVDPAVYNGNTPVTSALLYNQRWALLLSNNIPTGPKAFFGVRKPFTP